MNGTGLRVKLEDFAGRFESLGRKDQRAKGAVSAGLMLEGRRKPMQPMAERLDVDHQQLKQFCHVLGVEGGTGPARG